MERRRVVIVGDSLFAESLSQMLAQSERVSVIGCAPTPEAAVPLIAADQPDAVIVAEVDRLDARPEPLRVPEIKATPFNPDFSCGDCPAAELAKEISL